MKNIWYKIKKFKTTLLVLVFLVVLLMARCAEGVELKGQPYLELNRTTFNSSITMGGMGYRSENEKWDVAVQYLGEGDTKNGYQKAKPIISMSRIVNPGWRILGGDYFMRIGLSHTPDQQLIGDTTYRLGLGLRYDFLEVEVGHNSSADLWEVNKGLDYIGFRFRLN